MGAAGVSTAGLCAGLRKTQEWFHDAKEIRGSGHSDHSPFPGPGAKSPGQGSLILAAKGNERNTKDAHTEVQTSSVLPHRRERVLVRTAPGALYTARGMDARERRKKHEGRKRLAVADRIGHLAGNDLDAAQAADVGGHLIRCCAPRAVGDAGPYKQERRKQWHGNF